MPEVPSPKEFRRIFHRMELVDRHRLSKVAGAGRVADDPAEAALVAAAARRGLRGLPWLIVLMLGLFGLQLIRIATTDDQVIRWLSVAVMVIVPASIAKISFGTDRGSFARNVSIGNWRAEDIRGPIDCELVLHAPRRK